MKKQNKYNIIKAKRKNNKKTKSAFYKIKVQNPTKLSVR